MKRFERRFEGAELLDELLALSGSPCAFPEVVARFQEAVASGSSSAETIPTLFDPAPRFADPSLAPRLFGNLLALWDRIAAGQSPDPSPAARRPKPPRAEIAVPAPIGPEVTGEAFLEQVRAYLDGAPRRELQPLEHAFENREDALLGRLDALELSDQGYAQARNACFELWASMHLGLFSGARSNLPFQGQSERAADGLEGNEAAAVRAVVTAYLESLWEGRRQD